MVAGLGLDWEVGTRTGDTSAKEKAKQRTALPDILITTPESLHILIAQKGGAERLSKAQAVVVDEWHELLGSKRGVQVELAVSWMARRNPQRDMCVWGISATLAEPELALEALVGSAKGALIRADIQKDIEVESTMPQAFAKLPWAGHIGLQLLDEAAEVVEAHQHPHFHNTAKAGRVRVTAAARSQVRVGRSHGHAPRVHCPRTPGMGGRCAARRRQPVARRGDARPARFGVDFRPVMYVQVGGPKGVSRMIQRAGRCGHRPGEVSKAFFVPTHGLELIEAVACARPLSMKKIESKTPVILCWDVLVQWLCTLSVGDGFQPEEVRSVLAHTHAYGEMEEEDWRQCLDLISTGGPSLRAYTEHRRVEVDEEGLWRMRDRTKARRYRMSMGAIVSATMVAVHLKGQGIAWPRGGDVCGLPERGRLVCLRRPYGRAGVQGSCGEGAPVQVLDGAYTGLDGRQDVP